MSEPEAERAAAQQQVDQKTLVWLAQISPTAFNLKVLIELSGSRARQETVRPI